MSLCPASRRWRKYVSMATQFSSKNILTAAGGWLWRCHQRQRCRHVDFSTQARKRTFQPAAAVGPLDEAAVPLDTPDHQRFGGIDRRRQRRKGEPPASADTGWPPQRSSRFFALGSCVSCAASIVAWSSTPCRAPCGSTPSVSDSPTCHKSFRYTTRSEPACAGSATALKADGGIGKAYHWPAAGAC